jgi:hypothetical protein
MVGHIFWIKHRAVVCCVVAAGFFLFIVSAGHADPLVPGQTLSPPPLELGPSPDATVLFSTNSAFQATDFAGTLFSTVWTNDASNPYGGLTFTYEIQMNSDTADPISRMSISSYENFLTDVSYTNAPANPNDTPSSISRPSDNVIHISFETGGGLAAGEDSALIVIQTDSFNWQDTTAGFIDGATADAFSLAPASVVSVPEPDVTLIGLAGLAGLMFGRCRKNGKAGAK